MLPMDAVFEDLGCVMLIAQMFRRVELVSDWNVVAVVQAEVAR